MNRCLAVLLLAAGSLSAAEFPVAAKGDGVRNAENWKFSETRIVTADGSRVSVKDSTGVTGLR